jgi:hypothetical protein
MEPNALPLGLLGVGLIFLVGLVGTAITLFRPTKKE